MAMTALQTDMETCYERTVNLVRWTVLRWQATHGGDFDELMREANLEWLTVYRNHNPQRSCFTNWLRFAIWHRLLENEREGLRKAALARIDHEAAVDRLTVHHSKFWLEEFVECLSEDARLCARLALDTPSGLAKVIAGKGGRPHNYRSVIREYLTTLGWSTHRVTDSFREIADLLRSY